MYGFSWAIKLLKVRDLTSIAMKLPQGVTLVSSSCVPGMKFLEVILHQAAVYWGRGQFLARNKSLDLLMRVTCQTQIERAIGLSTINRTDRVVVFGLTDREKTLHDAITLVESEIGPYSQDEHLLELDSIKKKFLIRIHGLPQNTSDKQLVKWLEEKSVLLAFVK